MTTRTLPSMTPPVTALTFRLEMIQGEPEVLTTIQEGDRERTIGRYATDVQHIFVPMEAERLDSIIALDVLEHVMDEEMFLHECARLLRIGGRLELRVPAEGLVGWLDALNLYRYVTDTTNRGHDPKESDPSGWHRHYRNDDLVRMVCDAGFDVVEVRQTNPGLMEIPHMAGFLIGDFGLGREETESRLFAWRRKMADFENRIPAGPLGTRFTVVGFRV